MDAPDMVPVATTDGAEAMTPQQEQPPRTADRIDYANALRLLREYRFEHDEAVAARTGGKEATCLCNKCRRVEYLREAQAAFAATPSPSSEAADPVAGEAVRLLRLAEKDYIDGLLDDEYVQFIADVRWFLTALPTPAPEEGEGDE